MADDDAKAAYKPEIMLRQVEEQGFYQVVMNRLIESLKAEVAAA